jgi:hypothetical protein
VKRNKLSAGASPAGAGIKKRTPKKTPIKAEGKAGNGENGETPAQKKRGRKSKAEKEAEEAAKVKEESGEPEGVVKSVEQE